MPNRLAQESSPYLLQHKDNPVDWYAWGPEALDKAQAEEKPIFLSIGYSACHWCHVMEHESFENEDIARIMNEYFVNIKVDREERPDLDQIYMQAVQMLTGHGGWPMSVFLTPDGRPFYGGTYWPAEPRMGMPSFPHVLEKVHEAWVERREQAIQGAEQITETIERLSQRNAEGGELTEDLLENAGRKLAQNFDSVQGGFGRAPKFPHPMDLRLLLRIWKRNQDEHLLHMATFTLDKMAAGGIYDHLGGGFHRYSVDARWLVPHFEKMLYDNAQLAVCYLEAFQATGTERYARVARETLDYVLREMTDDQGGFYSTQDADSEGVEGKFYVWSPAEVAAVLGEGEAETFCRVYDVSEEGNFEGKNILNLPKTLEQQAALLGRAAGELEQELAQSRDKLLAAREERVHPGLDDKVIVSWNALMIAAMAKGGSVLGEAKYTQAAGRAAEFVFEELRKEDGRLLHAWRHGQAKFDAYLDDYACLIDALLELYEATFEERWIDRGVELANMLMQHFYDEAAGGFYYTAGDHESLIVRPRDAQDGSVPSGTSMAATALLRLGKLVGNQDYLEAAEKTLRSQAELMSEWPSATGQSLLALDTYLGPFTEVVLLGDPGEPETQQALATLRAQFAPRKLVAFRPPEPADTSAALSGLLEGKQPQDGLTLFVCENFSCQTPVSGSDAVQQAIKELD